jgi:hypothetical protein
VSKGERRGGVREAGDEGRRAPPPWNCGSPSLAIARSPMEGQRPRRCGPPDGGGHHVDLLTRSAATTSTFSVRQKAYRRRTSL